MEEVEDDPDEGKDSRRESPGSRESPGELYLMIFFEAYASMGLHTGTALVPTGYCTVFYLCISGTYCRYLL
jgi:hypothetical protein